MNKSIRIFYIKWISGLVAGMVISTLRAEPLFDTHLHYNARDAKYFSPQQIITILERNSIQHALVTSIPTLLAMQLYKKEPARILPLLGVYLSAQDKETWTQDVNLPSRVEAQLKQGQWRGIGEVHVFAKHRHSPVLEQIIKLAQHYKLPLLLHADPVVIDTVYEKAPAHPVIWAHAGTFPYPDLIADYLTRYPALRVDLSVRDERIAPNGIIRDKWYDVFIQFPDRFMIGVDTFSLSRWQTFDEAVTKTRTWLKQLPANVARQMMNDNARDLFNITENNSEANGMSTTTQ